MIPVFKSLEQIATGYTVFEKDQVLTSEQLNSVADYADDQIRLTRVKLLGVGIACGLRVSIVGNNVRVGRGVGVTTDGDLLYLEGDQPAGDTTFNRFKEYDTTYPAYPPLYVEGNLEGEMIRAFELVQRDVRDDDAGNLSDFAAATGLNLGDMVALLLMESYIKDDDICIGTDCDNLGREALNRVKLLLIEKASVAPFLEAVPTPQQAYFKLNEIIADRPAIASTLTTPVALAEVYRAVCTNIHERLVGGLAGIFPACSGFIGDVFKTDPSGEWTTLLERIRKSFAKPRDANIQYYYDFLKDVVETYNACRECLFEDTTWCSPNLASFPKHLLLGNLTPAQDVDENRTGFYPSPVIGNTTSELRHAKFLLRKLDMQIRSFRTDLANVGTRITPSLFEDQPLEERTIPYYYLGTDIRHFWNYRLTSRRRESGNYSYYANHNHELFTSHPETDYDGDGGADRPFGSQIGRYGFFRVEGHLGANVKEIEGTINRMITALNLPFTVRSVMLGADKTKVVKKPGIRYTDLHRFHYLLRSDVANRLDDVKKFSGSFVSKVGTAVGSKVVPDVFSNGEGTTLTGIAAQKNALVSDAAGKARTTLAVDYAKYRQDDSWKAELGSTLSSAGDFKVALSPFIKTDFVTPFDTLIGTAHIDWLPLLDDIIKQKDDARDERLLFKTFATRHPQLEHYGGVTRGGTFVLVYDESNTVVADFMLPYTCCDDDEEQPEEPQLPKPGIRPGFIVDEGIKIQPPRDQFFDDRFTLHRQEFEVDIDKFRKDFDDKLTDRLLIQNAGLDNIKKDFNEKLNEKLQAQKSELENARKEIDQKIGERKSDLETVKKELNKRLDDGAQSQKADLETVKKDFDQKIGERKSDTESVRKDVEKKLAEGAQTQKADLETVRKDFDQKLSEKIQFQTEYFDVFKKSVTLVREIEPTGGGRVVKPPFNDEFLGLVLEANKAKEDQLDFLRGELGRTDLPAERREIFAAKAKEVEAELANAVTATADYISRAKLDVAAGSEGATALSAITRSLGKIQDKDVRTGVVKNLSVLRNSTGNPGLKEALVPIIRP